MRYGIRCTCRDGHSSEFHIFGPDMTMEMAKDYCKILDGSSEMFIFSPREPEDQVTNIGRCNYWEPGMPTVCGRIFDAEVFEVIPGDPS